MRRITWRVLVPVLLLAVALLAVACSSGKQSSTPTPGTGQTPATGSVPPSIPHTLLGRSQCTTCHGSGISEIPLMPSSHAKRTDEVCSFCHKSLGETSTNAPAVPHTLAGRAECLICHASGIASAPAAPPNMKSLPNEHCLLCHQPGGAARATPIPGSVTPTPPAVGGPPAIPHALEGRTDCLMCHATGVAGAPAVPANHVGRTSNTCNLCHKPGGP
ncbi:MAG: hypothetical protein Q7K03_09315 [Dehalococcoidia bacterium]|nr:hypothetical protein [Dehalococcoidia bacterium]